MAEGKAAESGQEDWRLPCSRLDGIIVTVPCHFHDVRFLSGSTSSNVTNTWLRLIPLRPFFSLPPPSLSSSVSLNLHHHQGVLVLPCAARWPQCRRVRQSEGGGVEPVCVPQCSRARASSTLLRWGSRPEPCAHLVPGTSHLGVSGREVACVIPEGSRGVVDDHRGQQSTDCVFVQKKQRTQL